jgi:hypothetical protein
MEVKKLIINLFNSTVDFDTDLTKGKNNEGKES